MSIQRFPIPLILASTSPRRIDLMKQMHLDFEVKRPLSEEKAKRGEAPEDLVQRLALEKGESVRPSALRQYEKSVIISADTIVVTPTVGLGGAPGGKVLGKPRDTKEARKMLKLLAGRTHQVMTGYSLLLVSRDGPNKKRVRLVRSRVKMRALSAEMIERYLECGESMDKAGAYAAQGRGMGLIEAIQGSYSNVVGLPLSQLLQDLGKMVGLSLV